MEGEEDACSTTSDESDEEGAATGDESGGVQEIVSAETKEDVSGMRSDSSVELEDTVKVLPTFNVPYLQRPVDYM